MDLPAAVLAVVERFRVAAGTCVEVPCSFIWPGCQPPTVCKDGLSVSVWAELDVTEPTRAGHCMVIPVIDVHTQVSLCVEDMETADAASAASAEFYTAVAGVYAGLLTERKGLGCDGDCSHVEPGPFVCVSDENSKCVTYRTTWRVTCPAHD